MVGLRVRMEAMRQCSLASLVIHGTLRQRCRVPKGVYCGAWTGTLPKVGHGPKGEVLLVGAATSEQVGAAGSGLWTAAGRLDKKLAWRRQGG